MVGAAASRGWLRNANLAQHSAVRPLMVHTGGTFLISKSCAHIVTVAMFRSDFDGFSAFHYVGAGGRLLSQRNGASRMKHSIAPISDAHAMYHGHAPSRSRRLVLAGLLRRYM